MTRYTVEALAPVTAGGRLMLWARTDRELPEAVAYRVLSLPGGECAIYDNYTTAADVRNHLNSIAGFYVVPEYPADTRMGP